MKTNAKKYFKKYLTDKQLYKHFGLLCFVPLFFSSCASRLFISDKKWDFMHAVLVNSNAGNVKMTNKRGDHIGWLNQGVGVASNVFTIDKLRPGYLKVTFSHPDRIDTTIKIKRTLRPGALIFDCTFGAILCGIPLLADFANVNIYKIKRSSKVINLDMQYSNIFYATKFYNLKSTGTIADYKTYANSYPKSPFKDKAEQKMYELAYEKSSSENTIESYEKHNSDFPQSPFKNEAQNKIYTIAYAFAVTANTQAAYDNYIAKYPNAPNSETAKQNRAKVKQIDDAYAAAKTSGTYNAYKDFLTTYAGTKYTSEIATKMAIAYYNENNTKLKTLNDYNTSISLILDIEKQYKISCNKLKNLQDLRDNLIAEKLKPATTKAQYLAILKEQSKAETGQESDDFEAYNLKERVFTNSNCNINGTYNLWAANGQKVIATYQNNKLNGDYTKYAANEKTVLEKGTYNNGNKTGAYLVNFESGKKQYEKNYNNGSLQTEIEYDENGKNLTALREAEEKKAEAERIAEEKKREQNKIEEKLKFNSSIREITVGYVINRLKSPSTASLVQYLNPEETRSSLSSYGYPLPDCDEVKATMLTVDAQNSFGAYMRSTYVLFFKNERPCHFEDIKSLDKIKVMGYNVVELTLSVAGCACKK